MRRGLSAKSIAGLLRRRHRRCEQMSTRATHRQKPPA